MVGIRDVQRALAHPDTSRCLQGVAMVAQELVSGTRRVANSDTRLRSHWQGLEQIGGFMANKIVMTGSKAEPSVQSLHQDDMESKYDEVIMEQDQPIKDEYLVGNQGKQLRENEVPASRMGRVLGFGQLAIGLAAGSVGEVARRVTGASSGSDAKGIVLNESNAERIAESLCRMRGAALKLGQMLSIQDDTVLSPTLALALERVRQSADVMPMRQLEQVMRKELGEDWKDLFESFEQTPFAAASLGQVHKAVLKKNSQQVAVKIQFPGVADSIDSDLANLKRLASVTGIFPRGLFIDRIIEVMKHELKQECDYIAEAKHQTEFGRLLRDDEKHFYVPKVIPEASTARVLTSEFAHGLPIDKVEEAGVSQTRRNNIGRKLLRLTLRELFEFRYMQTDPNFSNFLYDPKKDRIVLLDFGATQSYGKEFVDEYIELVWAASNSNRSEILKRSISLGFLTGEESQPMVNAHIEAGLEVGRPFQRDGPFDFRASRLTQQMGKHGDTFLNERLTPPPREIYSLHRRLSGAYMTCIRIGAVFPCRDLLEEAHEKYYRKVNTSQ